MKKIIASILLVVSVLMSVVAFTACGEQYKVKVYEAYPLTYESYAFCVNKNQQGLLTSANELLAEIKANGKLDEIIEAHTNETSTFTHTNTVSSLPSDKDKFLVVATNAAFPPFESKEGNKFTGIDIEIASLLAEKLGKTLYIHDMEFDAIVPTVKLGNECYIGMAGMTMTNTRKEQVDFTDTYYETAQVIITTENDTKFDGCKSADEIIELLKKEDKGYTIGAQQGTTGFFYATGDADLNYEGFSNLTTKSYTTGALAVTDLSNGRIDAVIIDGPSAKLIAEEINTSLEQKENK